MIRPLKFRMWDSTSKTMEYDVQNRSDFGELIKRDDVYIMQCTCALDKNGTEIYEHDIIKEKIGYGLSKAPKNKPYVYCAGTIEYGAYDTWDAPGFRIRHSFNNDYYWATVECGYADWYRSHTCWEYHEIIGNIYESPHLLFKTWDVSSEVKEKQGKTANG